MPGFFDLKLILFFISKYSPGARLRVLEQEDKKMAKQVARIPIGNRNEESRITAILPLYAKVDKIKYRPNICKSASDELIISYF